MRPGRNVTICALVALFLSGCVMGIPDAGPPPKPTPECKIWVKVDNGPWRCYSREGFRRATCGTLFDCGQR